MPKDASLLVTYDYGSLSPVRLAEAAEQNESDVVFVTTGSEHAREMTPALEMVGSVIDTTGFDDSEILEALEPFKPSGIVTFSEGMIVPTARLAHLLELPYHSLADVGAITRKDLQRRRLAEKGVESVRFHEVTRVEEIGAALDRVGLPAIVKPTTGAASKHTVSVTTEAQCADAVARILDGTASPPRTAIVEELLVGRPVDAPWGDYLAVDCVADGEEVRPLFVTSKFALAEPYRERGGYGQASTVPQAELTAAQDLACRAVGALGIRTGIADVELKLTPAGPRVIEVNGRLGGWVDDLAVRSATADPADTAVRAALGRPPAPAAARSADAVAFHYLVMPPVTAHRVREVREGLFALRERPEVERVTITTRPGASADWRDGTDGGVAAVLGTAATHDRLADLVAEIECIDWIDYD
ncbi:acetyl-CoA carboxylase biotin carboxylase subunit family protein [Streptomyces sp. NPDC091972]|uniref:ATP-grasp domain-containing protein n=1 Tax=Streptomyces sp. NPDC091972 TaxID=3366007 RepID=UPI00381B8556